MTEREHMDRPEDWRLEKIMAGRGRRVGIGMSAVAKATIAAWLSLAVTGSAAEPEIDCGVNALFVLLRLEGKQVDLDRVLAALPGRHPDGYSMSELADASASLGCQLGGVRFSDENPTLRRPAIAFFKDVRGGHYTVLRPVGSTGKMVQAIDPPHAALIMDIGQMRSAKGWTGKMLVARERSSIRSWAIPLALAIAMLSIIGLWRRTSSQARVTRGGAVISGG